MEPLDLTARAPRAPRAAMLGYIFLPRTVDKLRAELAGGKLGTYLNHDTGFSAFLVRRLGLDMDAFRDAVRDAADEGAVEAWLREHIDPAQTPDVLNAKLETFTVSRMKPEDQVLVRERHPILAERPDLDKILDVLEAEDAREFGTTA